MSIVLQRNFLKMKWPGASVKGSKPYPTPDAVWLLDAIQGLYKGSLASLTYYARSSKGERVFGRRHFVAYGGERVKDDSGDNLTLER